MCVIIPSLNIIWVIRSRRVRWAGHVALMEEMRNVYKNNLIEKPEGKRRLGRNRRRWKDNSRMDLREIVWEGVDWVQLAQDMDQWWILVNTVMNLPVT
jgi:hypothetical protein